MYVSESLAGYATNYAQSNRYNSSESNSFQDVLEGCAQKDQVEISQQGASLVESMCNIEALLGVSPREDGSIHLEDLQTWFQENSAALGSEINSLLAAQGVDTSQPIDLTMDSEGKIRVANDHPDKEKIEKILAENPEIRNKFAQVSAVGHLLEAVEEHMEFAEEYARNPEAALEKYAHLFSTVKKAFSVRLEGGTLSSV
jgi:hypothetical protein